MMSLVEAGPQVVASFAGWCVAPVIGLTGILFDVATSSARYWCFVVRAYPQPQKTEEVNKVQGGILSQAAWLNISRAQVFWVCN
jgi:hypothetical protein